MGEEWESVELPRRADYARLYPVYLPSYCLFANRCCLFVGGKKSVVNCLANQYTHTLSYLAFIYFQLLKQCSPPLRRWQFKAVIHDCDVCNLLWHCV